MKVAFLLLPLGPREQAQVARIGGGTFPAEPSPWPLNFSLFLWKIEKRRVCSLVFVNLTQTVVAWEKETSNEQFPSSDWPVGLSRGHFLA